ncbi:DgyrCDS12838 [Dimorphilus gyrociliatus]|uniref:DgyrCDS12838 n=1 Tax=Dimorphilus gyrociliatus TaxID=2664684 RepID=A0A7I8W8W6_9ANNE|nr:DgyrCDS12838 [Dimorphilus gyrociliatus]
MRILIICTLAYIALVSSKKSYNGYELLNIELNNYQRILLIENLISINKVQPASVVILKIQPFVLLVHGEVAELIYELLTNLGTKYSIEENIDNLLKIHENYNSMAPLQSNGTLNLNRYHTYDNIVQWMFQMKRDHSNDVKIIKIGKSWQKRSIFTIKINKGGKIGRKAIWLDAGIHANEWIGPAVMLYFIKDLLTGNSQMINFMTDNFDWYITPVINPDGYNFAWKHDRLWRKTRSSHPNNKCVGVDANRNWNIFFGEKLDTKDECSNTYEGPFAFSEPEVKAVASFLKSKHDIIAYLAFHSYSQAWMIPFANSKSDKPRDYDRLINMAKDISAAVTSKNGEKYTFGRISEFAGEATGSSADYTYLKLNITYSFGVELRDRGFYGFLLPPDQIFPTAQENLVGLYTLSQRLASLRNTF